MLGKINEKLGELLTLKRDFGELSKRTEKIEAILSEFVFELDEEQKADLDDALDF